MLRGRKFIMSPPFITMFLRILVLALVLFSRGALAENSLRIVAVVNDDVISAHDLEARLSMTMASIKTKDPEKTRARLRRRELRRLIDDRLKVQESRLLNVRVKNSDIKQSLKRLEVQNNIPKGQLDIFLARSGIDKSALIEQIETSIAWAMVVNRRLRPRIEIGIEEVNEVLAQIAKNKGRPENLVEEIFLPLDGSDNLETVRTLAQRLVQQASSGSEFRSLARNFSQSASAAVGGSLGWIKEGQLGGKLDQVIAQMAPNQVSNPIQTVTGFYILKLLERRADPGLGPKDITVALQQIFFPLAADADAISVNEQAARAKAMADQAKTCQDMERLGKESGSPLSGSTGKIKLQALPAELASAVEKLKVEEASLPIRTAQGMMILMVCEREEDDSEKQAQAKIRQRLMSERLDIAARQYLRDLRRSAFIDIRM
jgi:peptidyl-prolyl cis-trans isomerase SurA